MANEEITDEPGIVELPDWTGPGAADPRIALGEEPAHRQRPEAATPRPPDRSCGETSHSPGVVNTPRPQSEG